MRVPRESSLFKDRTPQFTILGLLVILALVILLIIILTQSDKIITLMTGTPLPTRTANSYLLEGKAFFMAGNLEAAIQAYTDALTIDPGNVDVLIELAHLQVYSSKLLTPTAGHLRLVEAKETIDQATELDTNNSHLQAIRTLVYDWNASDATISAELREEYLAEAAKAAELAVQLDNSNALAIAFRAEVMADQFRFTQALQQAELAVRLDPNMMDTHRVYAYVLESTGNYSKAIEEYKAAAELMPNLTFLYISIGQNYRQLLLYDLALEYFDRAASINEGLGIKDPLPYLAIAKTYARDGQFFAAARNAEKALAYDPTNADIYGQLGFIRFRARNYEGAIPMLRCAVEGCEVLVDPVFGVIPVEEAEEEQLATLERLTVVGLPLSNSSVVYYYTYGSVLSAFYICDKAYEIFDQITEVYYNDELIMGIVDEGVTICDLYGGDQ